MRRLVLFLGGFFSFWRILACARATTISDTYDRNTKRTDNPNTWTGRPCKQNNERVRSNRSIRRRILSYVELYSLGKTVIAFFVFVRRLEYVNERYIRQYGVPFFEAFDFFVHTNTVANDSHARHVGRWTRK